MIGMVHGQNIGRPSSEVHRRSTGTNVGWVQYIVIQLHSGGAPPPPHLCSVATVACCNTSGMPPLLCHKRWSALFGKIFHHQQQHPPSPTNPALDLCTHCYGRQGIPQYLCRCKTWLCALNDDEFGTDQRGGGAKGSFAYVCCIPPPSSFFFTFSS